MGELDAGALVGGRYRVVRLLGRGGMGAVYHALHEPLGRPVALKVLPKKFATDARLVARFKREAETMAALQHPNIVQVNDFAFEPNGVTHLVMELLDGESLEQRLLRGPFETEETLLIARQLCEALAVAHANGVIHRDLKPANVFLTPVAGVGHVVKLLDFGIAKLLDDGLRLTSTGMLIGTPRYMSPEQVRGQNVTPATDVWALGVVLFEMVAARPPFEGDSLPMLVPQILGDVRPQVPSHVSEPLRTLIDKALQKRVDRRFRDAAEVLRALTGDARAFATTIRAPDVRPSTPAPTPAPSLPQHRRWPAVALLVAGLVGTLAYAWWNTRGEPVSPPGSSATTVTVSPSVPIRGATTSTPSMAIGVGVTPRTTSTPPAAVTSERPSTIGMEPRATPPAMTSTHARATSKRPSTMRVRMQPMTPDPAPEEELMHSPSMVVDDPANELIDVFPDG